MYRLALLLVAVGLGFAAVFVGSNTMAHYQAWRLVVEIEQWDRSQELPESRKLAHALETVERLIQRRPKNPHLRLLAASLYEWRAYLQRYSRRSANESRRRALDHVDAAIAHRPLWGRAWGARVNIGSRLGDGWNRELVDHLDTALRLGRYDLDTERQLVPFVIREWEMLPMETKDWGRGFIIESYYRSGLARSYIDDVLAFYPGHPLRQALWNARPRT